MQKLAKMGIVVEEKEIFSPIPAVCKILQSRGLRPYLVVSEGKQERRQQKVHYGNNTPAFSRPFKTSCS